MLITSRGLTLMCFGKLAPKLSIPLVTKQKCEEILLSMTIALFGVSLIIYLF
jgi:hypothetical protein